MDIIVLSPYCAYAQSNLQYSEEALRIAEKVLTDVGMWHNFNTDNEYMTRADTAAIVCMLTGRYVHGAEPVKEIYADVEKNHWAYKWIDYASYPQDSMNNSIMTGDGDGNFRPDDCITYKEFVKTLVTALSWAPYVKYCEEGYPNGYFKTAELLGIYPLHSDEMDNPVTKSDAIFMIYTATHAPALSSVIASPGFLFERMPDNYLMSQSGIYQIRGYAEKTGEDTIIIDDIVYNGLVSGSDFSGGMVVCYYRPVICFYKDNTITEKNVIVSCYPITSLTFDNIVPANYDNLPSEFWLK